MVDHVHGGTCSRSCRGRAASPLQGHGPCNDLLGVHHTCFRVPYIPNQLLCCQQRTWYIREQCRIYPSYCSTTADIQRPSTNGEHNAPKPFQPHHRSTAVDIQQSHANGTSKHNAPEPFQPNQGYRRWPNHGWRANDPARDTYRGTAIRHQETMPRLQRVAHIVVRKLAIPTAQLRRDDLRGALRLPNALRLRPIRRRHHAVTACTDAARIDAASKYSVR